MTVEQQTPRPEIFTLTDETGAAFTCYKWTPVASTLPVAVIQIVHGMAEMALRYHELAEQLSKCGYVVYAHDHRGHGLTAPQIEDLGYIGRRGFHWLIENAHQLSVEIKSTYPSLSIFLLGHSMGSFVVQGYMSRYGNELAGAILSGSSGKKGPIMYIGELLAAMAVRVSGPKTPSKFLQNLTFSGYNRRFRPASTPYDWLTRSGGPLQAYLDDPHCGTVFPTSFFREFFRGLNWIHRDDVLKQIPVDLPVYIFSGRDDPVGGYGKGVLGLVRLYQRFGLRDVTYRLYDKGRHEMLNEPNRLQVIADLMEWLEQHLISGMPN
jgi:alpha-beta hydrolase superfamily lysophospholipase